MEFRKKILLPIFVLSMVCVIVYYLFLFLNISNNINPDPMPLLAVSSDGNHEYGSIAKLYLDINQGNGALFMETYPLTKIDTQISTKLAKEIACDYLNKNCNKNNYFYKIESSSSIIGGPSAGSAIAVFTASKLGKFDIRKDVAVTGTISAGGIIGAVGGIPQKMLAAKKEGISTVLVPAIQIEYTYKNETINLIKFGQKNNITVIGITTLYDALDEFTKGTSANKKFKKQVNPKYKTNSTTTIDYPKYTKIMKDINKNLCNRDEIILNDINNLSKQVQIQISKTNLSYHLKYKKEEINPKTLSSQIQQNDSSELFKFMNKSFTSFAIIKNLDENAQKENENGNLYAASSYCYSRNVLLRELYYNLVNKTRITPKNSTKSYDASIIEYTNILTEYKRFNDYIETLPKTTITELESYIIVKERLYDGMETLGLNLTEINALRYKSYLDLKEFITNKLLQKYKTLTEPSVLASAYERLESAQNWNKFHTLPSSKRTFDQDVLAESCQKILLEVSEMDQYLTTEYPFELDEINKDINNLQTYFNSKEYDLCLSKGMNTKSRLNTLMNLLYNKDAGVLTKQNLVVAENLIKGQQENNLFPIMGYSYYEYAKSLLAQGEINSALYYSSIALEISNIDLYLKTEPFFSIQINYEKLLTLLIGFIIGINTFLLLSQYISGNVNRSPKNNITTKRDSKSSKTKSYHSIKFLFTLPRKGKSRINQNKFSPPKFSFK